MIGASFLAQEEGLYIPTVEASPNHVCASPGMQTPFCNRMLQRWALVLVATRSHFSSDVINVIHYRNAATLPLVPVPKKQKTTELFGLGCPFIWRRKRDSNPRAFWANGFQDFSDTSRIVPNNP